MRKILDGRHWKILKLMFKFSSHWYLRRYLSNVDNMINLNVELFIMYANLLTHDSP